MVHFMLKFIYNTTPKKEEATNKHCLLNKKVCGFHFSSRCKLKNFFGLQHDKGNKIQSDTS